MDVDFRLGRRAIASVFELLGTKENDITYSVGWALAQSPTFRRSLLAAVFPGVADMIVREIKLQQHASDGGYTDIELIGDDLHVIVEAKRGWHVPSEHQLTKYAARLLAGRQQHRRLIAMSECSPRYAGLCLAPTVEGIPVRHLGWQEIERLARVRMGTHAEKRLLHQLRSYIGRITNMHAQESNLVYVVALSAGAVNGSAHRWIDVVEKFGRYFHPIGNRWPQDPPNYMGFRYGGQLQRIHHVDSAEVINDFSEAAAELGKAPLSRPHFLYKLGPAIIPPHTMKGGKIIRDTRVWAMLDLLLTSQTLSDAAAKTKARRNAAGEH